MTALAGTRAATPDDLDAIMALERDSFPADAWSPAMMREELSSPHGWYVVVEEAGRLVGYAGLRAPHGAGDADIQTITIASGSRGRGRGRALLTTLLEEAARRRVRDVFLEVRADNPVAQQLYRSEGFAEVGRRPRYYQPDDVDAIVMRLDLRGWAARPRAADGSADRPASSPADIAGGGPADTPANSAADGSADTTQESSSAPGAAARDSAAGARDGADSSCVVHADRVPYRAEDAGACT